MKELIKKILKEQSESSKEKFIRYVASKLKPPYFQNLNDIGVEENEIKPILSLVFNQPVRINKKSVYDKEDNLIYFEYLDSSWEKLKYSERGKLIYKENSDGYWVKYGYNRRGKLIYEENSINGVTLDKR
jgi:hypothetical protein